MPANIETGEVSTAQEEKLSLPRRIGRWLLGEPEQPDDVTGWYFPELLTENEDLEDPEDEPDLLESDALVALVKKGLKENNPTSHS